MASARPITITNKGLKELTAKMRAAESALDPAELKPVLVEALRLFFDEAVKLLESEHEEITGNLIKSMKLAAGKSMSVATAWAKNKSKHAHLVEYGHVQWRGGERKQGIGHEVATPVKPHPFFRPALDKTRAAIRKEITRGIKSLLRRSTGFTDINPDDTGWIG